MDEAINVASPLFFSICACCGGYALTVVGQLGGARACLQRARCGAGMICERQILALKGV